MFDSSEIRTNGADSNSPLAPWHSGSVVASGYRRHPSGEPLGRARLGQLSCCPQSVFDGFAGHAHASTSLVLP
ncbi:hypothetical protein BH09ACT7_BH09ACT7_57720 [soil metagenome]